VSGPQSIAMAELADGRVLGLVSVGQNRTIYRTISADVGATWATLEPTSIWSVEPQLLVLPNDAIVVTAARPGLGLWVSVDGAGETFVRHDLAAHGGFSQAMVQATGPGSVVSVPETSGQTSLQLLDCYNSQYWGEHLISFVTVASLSVSTCALLLCSSDVLLSQVESNARLMCYTMPFPPTAVLTCTPRRRPSTSTSRHCPRSSPVCTAIETASLCSKSARHAAAASTQSARCRP